LRYLGIFILVLFFGCKVDSNNSNPDISAEEYTHLKYDFYINSEGTLFEKKFEAIDNLEMERPEYFDSTLFFPDYPVRVPLNKILDIESYKELEGSNYSKDKNNVYFSRATSDGAQRFIVKDANPVTFIVKGEREGRDDKYMFSDDKILKTQTD
jgi:hypothetical protein